MTSANSRAARRPRGVHPVPCAARTAVRAALPPARPGCPSSGRRGGPGTLVESLTLWSWLQRRRPPPAPRSEPCPEVAGRARGRVIQRTS
ncbi:MYXO-CTERM sorting domain-containing protein [Streptomyces purpureus]|uniref:MYXO-CTERM sorting domain-containing protein n=1 Tax=Streptomyces purpureus TaxID=1951 RepID=UPI0037BAFF0B